MKRAKSKVSACPVCRRYRVIEKQVGECWRCALKGFGRDRSEPTKPVSWSSRLISGYFNLYWLAWLGFAAAILFTGCETAQKMEPDPTEYINLCFEDAPCVLTEPSSDNRIAHGGGIALTNLN